MPVVYYSCDAKLCRLSITLRFDDEHFRVCLGDVVKSFAQGKPTLGVYASQADPFR